MSLATPKILVVDDNRANLVAMRKLLARLECDVVLAQSGNQALAACVQGDFALIFLDVVMSDMDGYEVAELLKGEESTRDIPIVFLTASHGDEEHRLRGYRAGGIDYIEKPVSDLVVLSKATLFLDLYVSKQRLGLELARSEAMRQSARENEARYRQALDGAPIPVMIHAEDGEVILVNRMWQDATGYPAAEIATIGEWTRRAFGSLSDDVRAHISRLFGIGGIVHEGEYVVRTAHGNNLIWNFRSTPLAPLPDGRRLIASMAEDITAYRRAIRAEEEGRRLALHADRAKGEFLANMSHEIRTPMNAIIGLTQLALETDISPRQQDYLIKIKSSSSALLSIINDILDYSKIEAGKLELERVPFFLEEMLGDVTGLFLTAIEQKGLELFVEVTPGTPLSLIGDPLRLGQVLNNLVGNAVKFTEHGEIHLRVEQEGEFEAGDPEVLLRFSVRDTGVGLSKVQVDRLFNPFVQADGSTTRRYGGTGLGLTISRHLVELMGGQIVVSSESGHGATFTFTVRLGLGTERRNLIDRSHLHGLKVLVVDDQETSCQILQQLIESWSGVVTTRNSGLGVIELVRQAELEARPFELLLLDWQMPELNGVEIARRIEAEAKAGRLKRPPMVVMVTAFSRHRLIEEAAGLQLDNFLTKPVTPSSLLNAVVGARTPGRFRPADRIRLAQGTPYELAIPIRGAEILLVEDNAINQDVAREFLEKAGLSVTLAGNGRQGVEAVCRSRFDAVLMDMQMPEMDGFEATRMIRTLPQGQALPIIAMTAAVMPRDRQACADAGMNDYIAKPIVPKEVLETLLKWIPPRAAKPDRPPYLAGPGEPFPDIPGIDRRQAALRLCGNRALFGTLLGRLVREFKDAGTIVRVALADGRRDEAARRLHLLRGVAGNVSANEVARLASRLEAAIKDNHDARVPGLLDQLEAGLGSLCLTIGSGLAAGDLADPAAGGSATAASGGAAITGQAPDQAALDTLTAALETNDAVALECMTGLYPALEAWQGTDVAVRLRAAVEELRFPEAAAMLAEMRGRS